LKRRDTIPKDRSRVKKGFLPTKKKVDEKRRSVLDKRDGSVAANLRK